MTELGEQIQVDGIPKNAQKTLVDIVLLDKDGNPISASNDDDKKRILGWGKLKKAVKKAVQKVTTVVNK